MRSKLLEELLYINDLALLTLYMPIPQNGQAHSTIRRQSADELFECD